MGSLMKRVAAKGLFLFFLLIVSQAVQAQSGSDLASTNLSTINVDNLSDEQIQQFLDKAEESGLSQTQLEALAKSRGMSSIQITKLRNRISELQMAKSADGADADRQREDLEQMEQDSLNLFTDFVEEEEILEEEEGLKIFGSEIFSNAVASFTPVQNIATPENYVLGPGDEIIIDVFGASEMTYQEAISPDGKIFISGVGPVVLAGVSIKQARVRILNKLHAIYSGLKSPNRNTFIEVSIGNIRTIKVDVVGLVTNPGSYSLSSLSTAFSALYAAGGPSEQGSMREISIMRDGKSIATLDVYKYFFLGDNTNNPLLRDGDAVVVRPYKSRIEFDGPVKNPAIYELLVEETVSDLLTFSGGFAPEGLSKMLTISGNDGYKKVMRTVEEQSYGSHKLQSGDKVQAMPILDRYSNLVELTGAVYLPGAFELVEGLTLAELIKNAGGFREDVYLGRGNILRKNADLTLSNLSFSIQEVQNGSYDVALKNEDVVNIPSISDIIVDPVVVIEGEVRKPGTYPYSDSLTVEDLIGIAGSFTISAEKSFVEVARRVSENDNDLSSESILYNFQIDQKLGLSKEASTFQLKPFDLVIVRESPTFKPSKTVTIEGEVLYPGKYAIEFKEERISDIISRAGGYTNEAYPAGGTLIRKTEYFDDDAAAAVKKARLQGLAGYEELGGNFVIQENEAVAVQIDKMTENPGSKIDLIIKDGDIISVPKQLQTVRVRGEVYFSSNIIYQKKTKFKRYVSSSGGFTTNARKGKSYVIYPSGNAKKTRKFVFLKFYPKVLPGSEIIVPSKPEREQMNAQQWIGITTSLVSLTILINNLVN